MGILSITIEPPAASWRGLVAGQVASPVAAPSDELRVFRRELGLPEGAVVMSGHQAGVWHAGILAKLEALSAFAESAGAQAVWLMADQDDNDPTRIAYPSRGADGAVSRETWAVSEAPVAPGAPNGQRSPVGAGRAPRSGFPAVDDGLERIRAAVEGRREAPSLGEQFTRAALELSGLSCPTLPAMAIARTSAYARLIDRMRSDPRACAEAYNGAVEAHPEAGVRPLAVDGRVAAATELPIWNVAGSFRKPVFARDLADLRPHQTAPKALLMTGLMRSLGCDLFIHGTGGVGDDGEGGYDAVTDAWLGAWSGMGRPRAPGVLTTATLTLDLGLNAPTDEEIERAQQLAHKAQHDPAVVGDEASAERKRALVERIARAKAEGRDPGGLFREMQDLLTAHRERNAVAIERLRREADALSASAGEREIALDRTWAFPLHSSEARAELRARIRSAFAVGGA